MEEPKNRRDSEDATSTVQDMREYGPILMGLRELALDLFAIFTEAVAKYNSALQERSSLRMYLEKEPELQFRRTYAILFSMYEDCANLHGCSTHFGCAAPCESFIEWNRPNAPEVSCKKTKDVPSLRSGGAEKLKNEIIDQIVLYISENLTKPFDRFFVNASQAEEREIEELGLQCKLVVDRKVGEYFSEESLLGWASKKVKNLIVKRLNALQKNYLQGSIFQKTEKSYRETENTLKKL